MGLVLALFMLHVSWNQKPKHVEASETVLGSVTFGTTLAFVQTLNIFGKLQINWPVELKAILDFFAIFLFDFDLLRVDCLLSQSLSLSFLIQVFSPLVIAGIFLAFYLLSQLLRPCCSHVRGFSIYSILNSYGLFFQTIYISIASSSVSLFECTASPNGQERWCVKRIQF